MKINLTWIKYFVLIFYFIYLPDIPILFNIPIRAEIFVAVAFFYIIVKLFIYDRRGLCLILWNKDLTKLYISIFVSASYFFIVAIFNDKDPRIFQNLFILFHLFVIIYLLNRVVSIEDDIYDGIVILFQTAAAQGIISIIMIFSSKLRSLAFALYYIEANENYFIERIRIFGISGEYTFFTPVYHGLLLALILYLYLFHNKNYFIYSFFIMVAIALNGRMGLLIAIILSIIILLYYLVTHFTRLYKIILLLSISVFAVTISLLMLNYFLPLTISWIKDGFIDIINFLFRDEFTGNFEVLDNMLIFPEGKDFIFGKGFRLYLNNFGYPSSDIGFSNDLFMGGIIYVLILYIGQFRYLFANNNERNTNEFCLSLLFLTTLIVSNFKGESSRGGLILLGIIILKYLLVDMNKSALQTMKKEKIYSLKI